MPYQLGSMQPRLPHTLHQQMDHSEKEYLPTLPESMEHCQDCQGVIIVISLCQLCHILRISCLECSVSCFCHSEGALSWTSWEDFATIVASTAILLSPSLGNFLQYRPENHLPSSSRSLPSGLEKIRS